MMPLGGIPVLLGAGDEAVAQWVGRSGRPLHDPVHVQFGTLADGGWYLRHLGFGTRAFPDKKAAWAAFRAVAGEHGDAAWAQTAVDDTPFRDIWREDGSRILYSTYGASLQACWGDRATQLWDLFLEAIAEGSHRRSTEAHSLLGGVIEVITYNDPLDGSRRHAVWEAVDAGSDWEVVDHPHYEAAEAHYLDLVHEHLDDDLPYLSSDVETVKVGRNSTAPPGTTAFGDGTLVDDDDLAQHKQDYGLRPRVRWPETTEPRAPEGPVSGMTAAPRPWSPAEVGVEDVTPRWAGTAADRGVNAVALAVLPDGRELLVTAHDDVARVWSAGDGRVVRTIAGHDGPVLSAALDVLANGHVVLATGSQDGMARLWSAREGDPLEELHCDAPVHSVAWLFPVGTPPLVVTGAEDATAGVWNAESGRRLAVLRVGEPGVNPVWSVAAAVLPDGRACVAVCSEGVDATAIDVWSLAFDHETRKWWNVGQVLAFALPHDPAVVLRAGVAIAVLVDRSVRLAAVAGSVVRVWDVRTGEVVASVEAPDGATGAVALAVLPDLRVVVAASGREETLLWDAESGHVLTRLSTPGRGGAVALAPQPDGHLLVAVSGRDGDPPRVVRVDVRW